MNVPMLRTRILHRIRRRDPWSGLPVRSTLTTVGEHQVHAVEFGRAEQCVLLVHGLAGTAGWWRHNVEALCTRYRVVIPDLIGFGRTRLAGELPDIAEIAELLVAWMDQLGIGLSHLVGHSMGGQISVHLAGAFPERIDRLVLVDSAGIPRPLNPREVARSALQMAPPRRWGDPRFLRTILGDAMIAGPRTLVQALRHIVRDDVRPLLPHIRAPTLIVWGGHDHLIPAQHAEIFRREIPNSRLVVLRRAAHNPMVDRPAEFNSLLLRFLRGETVGQ
jgi:pimeloyl-ACP methyl ester carboxylesterase